MRLLDYRYDEKPFIFFIHFPILKLYGTVNQRFNMSRRKVCKILLAEMHSANIMLSNFGIHGENMLFKSSRKYQIDR
jgi:hypothetical protein